MKTRYSDIVLTEAQKHQWQTDGYLLLKGVLSRPEVRGFLKEVMRLRRKDLPNYTPAPNHKGGWDCWNGIQESATIIPLIDHPGTFGLVLDFMGPYIQLCLSQMIVRSPNREFKGYIHTDGGHSMGRIQVTETSLPLQIKIQYFLTDLLKPNSGNFVCFPGSQNRPFPVGQTVGVETPGAVQLLARAGDAVIFLHSLWHGVAPNRSNRARKSIIFGYSQMFLRSYDYKEPSRLLLQRCTPRQRRLLGNLGNRNFQPGDYFYAPSDQIQLIDGKKKIQKS